VAEDWQIEFLKDSRTGRVPAREFLDEVPDEPAAELLATLQAVEGTRPPFAFRGGARWQAMSGDMSGWFEARDKHKQLLYRLFVRLDRDPPGLPHNAIVVVDGGVKRNESAFTDEFYADLRDQWERYVASTPRSVA
jgi:hypothetical protein